MYLLTDEQLAEIERRGRKRLLFTCGQAYRNCDGCSNCWRNLLELIREVAMDRRPQTGAESADPACPPSPIPPR